MISCASGNDGEIILVGIVLIISDRKELELKEKIIKQKCPKDAKDR